MMGITILLAGFGRFPGAPVNPSALLVTRLARIRRPALAEIRRLAHVFPTRYAAVGRELPMLIERERPDAIVLFGVARKAEHLRIETRACNRMSVIFPDAGGFKPQVAAIATGAASSIASRVGAARLVAAVRSTGGRAPISRNAGSYLCNYAYWHALEASTKPGGPRLVVFVHVPPVRLKSLPRRRNKKRPHTLSALTRAGEAIVLAVLAMSRANSRQRKETR
jgi:pyroglutamyl-peptidase